jgi:hypothetical protein
MLSVCKQIQMSVTPDNKIIYYIIIIIIIITVLLNTLFYMQLIKELIFSDKTRKTQLLRRW